MKIPFRILAPLAAAVVLGASPTPAPAVTPSHASAQMPIPGATSPPGDLNRLPPGTKIVFHVVTPVSSDKSKNGDPFAFAIVEPVVVDGRTVIAAGASGTGTVILAGKSGNEGHEGDLTLRLDTATSVNGTTIAFDRQTFEVNGGNLRAESSGLGLVPFAGLGAFFIHGKNITLDDKTAVTTVLLHPADDRRRASHDPNRKR